MRMNNGYIIEVPDLHKSFGEQHAVRGVSQVAALDGTATVLCDDSNRVLPALFDVATDHDARITAIDIREPNLEAVSLHLTGKALRD